MIYGHNKTIHGTQELSVEVSESGEVVAVWFRCMPLPFHVSTARPERAEEMKRMTSGLKHRLVAVEVSDKETE